MESFFNADLGDVRVHADAQAARAAASQGAEAFTIGRDIYFGEGKFDPASAQGKALLGHELTHVLQQRGRGPRRQGLTRGSVEALETEAQAVARRVETGGAELTAPGFAVDRYLCTYRTSRPPTDAERKRLEMLSRAALEVCEETVRASHPDLLKEEARTLETVTLDLDASLAGRSDREVIQAWGRRLAGAIVAALSRQSAPAATAAVVGVLKAPAEGGDQPQPATTNVTVATQTFDVEAETLDGAAAALDTRDEWGKTRWTVTFGYEATDGVVTSVSVTAKITIELPRWTALGKQPRRVRAEWNRMLEALRRHESEHARIARERISRLAGEMAGKPEPELAALHAQCVQELDALSEAYDRRCDHGRTEGVTLDLDVAAQRRSRASAGTREGAEAEARAVEQALLAGTTPGVDLHASSPGWVQRKPAGGPPRTKYKAADAAALVARKFPNLKVPADQLAILQRLLDARAALKEIDEDPVWASILSEDDPRKEALRREASEWAKDDRVQALVIPTEMVLAGDILLKEEKDERTQRTRRFREQLYATMLTFPVRLVIAPKALEPDLTMRWGPNDWELPNDGGRVTFKNLMAIQKFNVAYQAALAGDQVELLEGMAEVALAGTTYYMTGKKVGETFGYVWNTAYRVGHEIGRLTGYSDDPRGRQELEGAKGAGARIVLKNPEDGYLHVYALDPALNFTDLRAYDKDLLGDSTTGMVYLYALGSEVGAVDEIVTADGFYLTPGGDSYGTGWGTSQVLNEYEKFAIGAIMGDAFEQADAVATFGQIVIGCIPIVGQIADARDVAVGIHKIWTSGGKEGKLQTALALIGIVPVLGDGVKAAWKAGRKGIKGPMTKELAKELAAKAVKEGAGGTAETAAKELGDRILKNADEVADALKVSREEVKATVKNLDELATKAAAGDAKAAKEFGEQMGKQLDALGGNAGSLVGMMGGDWAKLAKMLTTSPEGALVGQAMERWRTAQFATLDKKVAAKVGDVGAQAGVDTAPKMARTGTPSFASDVDISFLGPMSTQHRNAAIHIMEQQFGPGWRQLMDADIFADPARLHLFEDPLKQLGGKAGKEAGARIIKESELNVFAKMLKDGVPYEEVKRLADAAGVDMAQVAARQKEITRLSVDRLAAELRKGTPEKEVEKLAKEMHINMEDVRKHLAGGEQLYKQLELKLDALHAQFEVAKKAGDVAKQAQLAEEMAAIQGKLNAAIPGPYMTPGGGAKHVSRREKALRPGGAFQAMSPILGYTAVIDDLYMLMHALPEKEFTEKSAKGMAKYGDRLLVTAGQFGVEMKGSTRGLFDQISGLLERARLEKDKPALEKAIGSLEQAKGTLNSQLTDIIAGAKRNASEYLKNTPDAAPATGPFVDRTQKVVMQQAARVALILIRKDTMERDRVQGP